MPGPGDSSHPREPLDRLPPEEASQYNDEQRRAFGEAYRAALDEFEGDEDRALEVARAAARGTPGDR